MAKGSPWPTIHAERQALADDLGPIGDAQWATPSLSAPWSVRDVLGYKPEELKDVNVLSFVHPDEVALLEVFLTDMDRDSAPTARASASLGASVSGISRPRHAPRRRRSRRMRPLVPNRRGDDALRRPL